MDVYGIFVVSVIYWTTLLVLFVWLNRRLSALKERIAELEGEKQEKINR